jgi:MFS superfamily sulfate permease-like transporter
LADFLSRTVLVGFLTGVGVQVAGGQLQDMLGIEKQGHGFFRQLFLTFSHLGNVHLPSLFIALAALAIIVGCEFVAPRFPGGLLAVIGMTMASAFFHWGLRGVHVVGDVPSGLPHLGIPHLTMSNVVLVAPISFSCFIVILAQSAATSRAYALRYRDAFNQNADLVGLSFANAIAGCSGTFVVNGSPTKTAMVDTAGGRSQWSHVTTAAVVVVVLLFFTRPLSFLPNPVLASIVFLIGVKLIDYRGMAAIRRAAPREFILALITAATVVFFGVEQGILLAVILSLLMHVRHSYRPHVGVLVRDDADHWRLEDPVPGRLAEPGLVMFWFGAGLFYANASFFAAQVRKLIEHPPSPVRWLVIDARAVTELDYSGGRALAELHQDLAREGITLGMIVVQARHRGSLESMGLVDLLGADRIFESRYDCIHAYRSEISKSASAARSL